MPYADLPVTRAMQPLKLKEYLATGRPVVVRDLPATRAWADCLDLADTPEAFCRGRAAAAGDGLPEGQQAGPRPPGGGELGREGPRTFERTGPARRPPMPSACACTAAAVHAAPTGAARRPRRPRRYAAPAAGRTRPS